MTLAPGTTVGRYQILEPLGQGGMATVYKAFQPSLQRDVALKVLRPGYSQDAEFRERFEREAIAIAKLRHPHIVQIFDFEVAPSGEYVLAMEFLEGGTLKDRLSSLAAQGRGLDPAQSIRVLGEVAEALSYAHEKGVVHRDVKPSNVMLTHKDRAVVTDFGIARILGATSHTQTGVGIGTPEYMAPEQGQGTGIDHRADIYSLGALAYELLVGRVPYSADTPLAVVLAHIKDPLPLPSRVNPTVGPAVEKALLKALAKDPEQRYDSAVAFAEALRDGLAADSAGGTMPTVVVRGAEAPRAAASRAGTGTSKQVTLSIPSVLARRPVMLGVATALVLALVAGGVVAGDAFRSAPPSSAPTPASAPTVTPPIVPPTAAVTAAGTITTTSVPARPSATDASLTLAAPSSAIAPAAVTPTGVAPAALPTATLPPATPPPTPLAPPTIDPTAPKFAVTGHVTSSVAGAPLANVAVQAGFSSQCCVLLETPTDANGNFRLDLPNGTYHVLFRPSPDSGHASIFWGGAMTYGAGRDLVVNGASVAGVDAGLPTGFLVTVSFTTAGGGAPSQRQSVNVFVRSTTSGEDWYTYQPCVQPSSCALRLPNGTYRMKMSLTTSGGTPQWGFLDFTVGGRDVTLSAQAPQ